MTLKNLKSGDATFDLEENDCDIHFWGRTHSPCVRDNDVGHATYCCDSRLRSGYGRFERNRYAKGVNLGKADPGRKSDTWDFVLSGLTFDGGKDAFNAAEADVPAHWATK